MPSAKAKDVDEYIASASDCTRPILVKLRRIFQQASPKLQEAIKWGVPCYEYKGPVGGFAAYKQHVSWGLWKARLLNDPDGLVGHGIVMGGKITKVSEIPPTSKVGLRKPPPDEPAMDRNSGVKVAPACKRRRKTTESTDAEYRGGF